MPASRPWSISDWRLRSTCGERSLSTNTALDEVGAREVEVVLGDALGRVAEQLVGVVTEHVLDVHPDLLFLYALVAGLRSSAVHPASGVLVTHRPGDPSGST